MRVTIMKEFPEIKVPLTQIYEMSLAPVQTNALVAGVELAIFDQLNKPIRAEELAEKCGFDARTTAEYLNVLTACELVTKKRTGSTKTVRWLNNILLPAVQLTMEI